LVLSLRDLFQTVFDLKRKQEAEASRGEASAVATTEGAKSAADENQVKVNEVGCCCCRMH